MNIKSDVPPEVKERFISKINEDARDVLWKTLSLIKEVLSEVIDGVDYIEGCACYFREGRELIRVNVCKTNLRIYINPPAGVAVDEDEEFEVERFNLWKSSYRKGDGKYHGLTVWVSETGHLRAFEGLLERIVESFNL
jgi:uncharacterized protein YdhG (YjbR/CyaY superfamily)